MSDWVPERLDVESDQIRQVYAKYGAAMYFAQVLEHGLTNFIVISRVGRTVKSQAAIEASLNALFASTMGKQLRELLAEANLDASLIERLRNALRVRNFLAHDYFRERAEEFLSSSGRNRMLAELEDLRAELEAVDDELEPTTRSMLVSKGISEELVRAEFERLHAEYGDRD